MEKIFVFLISLILISCETDLEPFIFRHFQKFINKYNKNYNSINEFFARYQVFRNNILIAYYSKESSYRMGITQFSDLTQQEFNKKYLNLNYDAMAANNFNPYYVKVTDGAPSSFDWREENAVNEAKNQGTCSASWAFSVIGNLEGLYAKHYGVLEDFSESMLIDCDSTDMGCNGGLMEYALTWLKGSGIMRTVDYPYKGYKDTCRIDYDKIVGMTVTGFIKLGSSSSVYSCVDEEEIKEFLYENGPLSVAFNANPLQMYTGGVIDSSESQCPPSGINHSALLVGYGTDSRTGLDYWIVKNSWGKTWGESGFFRIRRGNGTCGINCYVITATVTF